MLLSLFDISIIGNMMQAISAVFPQSLAILFLMATAIIMVNICILVIFAFVGNAFLRRMRIASGDLEQQKQEAHKQAEILLENARKESLHIIEKSSKKADELLQQTEVTKEMFESHLAHVLEGFSQKETQRITHLSEEFLNLYRATIESSKQQYVTTVETTVKEMATHTHESLKQFEEFLKDQTTRYESTLKQQVQTGFMSAQKEISDYKRESLRKVEEAIYRILNLVTKSVIGKALSLEDQQDLVIHALDEAKQQGFFEL